MRTRYEAPPPWPQLTSSACLSEPRLSRRAMVQLDAVPVGLIGRRQRQAHRRILFIAVVETHDVFRFDRRLRNGYQYLFSTALNNLTPMSVMRSVVVVGMAGVCQVAPGSAAVFGRRYRVTIARRRGRSPVNHGAAAP